MSHSHTQSALATVWRDILIQLHTWQPDEFFDLCKHAGGEIPLSTALQYILGPDGYGLVGAGQACLDDGTKAIIQEATEARTEPHYRLVINNPRI